MVFFWGFCKLFGLSHKANWQKLFFETRLQNFPRKMVRAPTQINKIGIVPLEENENEYVSKNILSEENIRNVSMLFVFQGPAVLIVLLNFFKTFPFKFGLD